MKIITNFQKFNEEKEEKVVKDTLAKKKKLVDEVGDLPDKPVEDPENMEDTSEEELGLH